MKSNVKIGVCNFILTIDVRYDFQNYFRSFSFTKILRFGLIGNELLRRNYFLVY